MSWTLADQFIGSDASKLAIVGTTVLATAAIVGAVSVVFGRRQAKVERRLVGYDVGPAEDPTGRAAVIATAETTVIQQGVALAGRFGERTGYSSRLELLLAQADLPMRASEILFYVPVFAILGFLLFSILFGLIAGLLAAAIIGLIPLAMIQSRARKRLQKFDAMLPPTLTLLASSMRAGFSLMQALETVAQESPEPVRRELQRVFTEVRLGRTVEDALGEVADRMASRDLVWTVMAIQIQREVGGNLAALLDTVAETMTQRERLRREVRSLTAEGRLSAVVLSLFAPALAFIIWIIRPDYLDPLLDYAIGVIAVVLAIVLNIVGWLWLRRIVDIKA